MHKSKEDSLTPLHVVSVLDSMLKLETAQPVTESGSNQKVKNWMILESIMGRSKGFFDTIEDAALITMLLKRLHQSRSNLDVDELFEKAEIKLLELFQYDAAHSDERMLRNMANSEVDCEDMADLVEAFMLAKVGGPIFKCAKFYTQRQTEINSAYLKLLHSLDIAGIDMSAQVSRFTRRIERLGEDGEVIDQFRAEYLLAKYDGDKKVNQ